MKQIVLFLSILLLCEPLFSQEITEREYTNSIYPENIETIKFEVLGIDFLREFLAFKHIYKLATVYDETGEISEQTCNCHYAGLNKNPYAGVILGTYDLMPPQSYSDIFVIYNSSYDESECTDFETSENNLAEAKELFKDSRINISDKPKPISFEHPQNNISVLKIKGITFKAVSENITDEETADMLCISKLYADEKLIYIIKQKDDFTMGSSGLIKYVSAYQQDNKIVFLNVFHHTSSMSGIPDKEIYHFSPVFDLTDLKSE